MFYLNSTLNFGIPPVLVFQSEVYCKVDRLLTGITAQHKGTTARWYSNKTSLPSRICIDLNFNSYTNPHNVNKKIISSNLSVPINPVDCSGQRSGLEYSLKMHFQFIDEPLAYLTVYYTNIASYISPTGMSLIGVFVAAISARFMVKEELKYRQVGVVLFAVRKL